jgi:hypothetical protein
LGWLWNWRLYNSCCRISRANCIGNQKGEQKMIFDNMTKEEYNMSVLLKNKSRMEQDEILGNLEKR